MADWSRIRITTDSPCAVGRQLTRRSTGLPATVSAMRPSCGTRRSEMLRFERILMREMIAGAIFTSGAFIS